jgi:DNA-binding CsgD family transcriptional regulator
MPDLDPSPLVLRLSASRSVDALARVFGEAIRPLGMTASAGGMVSGPRALSANPFHFTNWPAAWIETYRAQNFLAIDPMPRWAIVSGEAVSWTEVLKTLRRSDPGYTVMRAANAHGFHEGFVTPVRTRTGALGIVAVAGGARAPFSIQETVFLQMVSTVALTTAEVIAQPPAPTPSAFTRRERECISLLRQGLTDAEMGRVLGIGLTTVRSHLENARRKAGARNRVELATR